MQLIRNCKKRQNRQNQHFNMIIFVVLHITIAFNSPPFHKTAYLAIAL
jgi:hypothetical protein